MSYIQGYFIDLTDSEYTYLSNLESIDEKRIALNGMLQDRFAMGREYGKTTMRDKLFEGICDAIRTIRV